MNRHVNAIAGRLSLRPPQRRSLEILDRVTEVVPPRRGAGLAEALRVIQSEFPAVTDFEREFPSLCFALATGVGKTRLMGAFISYLHLAHGMRHFFVLAPNLTIYNKLIADFTPNTPKYVFTGIAEFATEPPVIITGDSYESGAGVRGTTLPGMDAAIHVNIFNISKINAEVRGGKTPRIKRLSEYIGESYFEYLAGLDDLVLLMDESHRYRASAGVRAINELKPVLGLELTATPFIESSRGPVAFKNVIYDYPLAMAMQDGFVKEPAVVTQKNFDPNRFSAEQIERIKLEDGMRLHENVKVELETYARQTGQRIVKPFLLIIARDITHATQLLRLIQSEEFFEGRYKDKVIQVDSSKTGAEEDEMVQRLLAVEKPEEPTEIVIHVNMLKEGWDVTNLYTIVPLRAANARTLIEQSIGRGLRLPYGKRAGVTAVDRLNIVAHDRFQEIIDEANRPDSVIRLQQVILDPERDLQRMATVVVNPTLTGLIGGKAVETNSEAVAASLGASVRPVFTTPAEHRVAQTTLEVIQRHEHLPSMSYLQRADMKSALVKEVEAAYRAAQVELPGVEEQPDIPAVVERTVELAREMVIEVPRILVVPKGEVTSGFHPFELNVAAINYQPVERDILIRHLRTQQQETLSGFSQGQLEARLEDYIVRGLIDFDDISYDDHADLLYDLAGQVVSHLRAYLHDEDDVTNVLQFYQRQLAQFIHAQMQEHHWEKAAGYEVVVKKGFMQMKAPAYTAPRDAPVHDFRSPVADKSKIAQLLFGGFQRCLYSTQKFQSDSERKLAVILDRESLKWFRPAKGQVPITYKCGGEEVEYVPDFVAETEDCIYMMEPKARGDLDSAEVEAKKSAAALWCKHATDHTGANGGKPWRYLLIPHDAISDSMTVAGLAAQFTVPAPGRPPR